MSGNLTGLLVDADAGQDIIIRDNYIGTDITGTKAVANAVGLGIDASEPGATVGPGNVISGNTFGVDFGLRDGAAGGSGSVFDNLIGTDASGEQVLGNTRFGIIAFAGSTTPSAITLHSNVIAGNGLGTNEFGGIHLAGNFGVANVTGNLIGTDAAGTAALPNAGHGISLSDASNVTIGGTVPGSANVISGNTGDGILIDGTNSNNGAGVGNNLIEGNSIGTDLHDTIPLGNGVYGINIMNSNNNTIGGATAGAGNVIAYNTQGGVQVTQGTGNAIHANAMFANGIVQFGPGIVLASGGNNNQVAPSLIVATYVQATENLTVGGFFVAKPGMTYVVDFFAGPAGDPEGKIYLGSKTVTAKLLIGTPGLAIFQFTELTPLLNGNPLITATVTDPSGNTSAFSSRFDPPPQNSASVFVDRLYADLLGRLPDDAELAHWTSLMHHGTAARQVAADLMRTSEFRTIEAETAYHTYLQRDASTAELAAATHFLAVGGTVEQLQVRLVTSPEYWRLQGATGAGFVNGLYQAALGHAPDAAELAVATRALHPARLADAVFTSAEYRRDLVENDCASLLGQVPDKRTEQALLTALAGGGRDEDVLADVFGSAEFRKWLS
jgi:hypothetical protein